MLPKENRLKKDKDFQRVYLKGKTFQNNFIIVKTLKTEGLFTRFGFVISNKISKKATIRNKLKRRLREIIRLNLSNFIEGFDIIIIPKKNILTENFDSVKNNLISLFKEIKIFKN